MNFYQEITLIEQPIDADIPLNFLWAKTYRQLHIAFAEYVNTHSNQPLGVSFPNYLYDAQNNRIGLGKKIRVFAKTREELMILNLAQWLERLTDYVELDLIEPVPNEIQGYAIYQRYQVKSNPERLARRYAKRHNISYEEALKTYQATTAKTAHFPFIQMRSLSGDQPFKLFIKKTQIEKASLDSIFTTYGLSSTSSVPEF